MTFAVGTRVVQTGKHSWQPKRILWRRGVVVPGYRSDLVMIRWDGLLTNQSWLPEHLELESVFDAAERWAGDWLHVLEWRAPWVQRSEQ